MFWKKKQLSFAKQLKIVPPPPSSDRQGLAIVFLVKNEAKNLAEWIGFHELVGVKHFFAYDDGSTDNSCEILKKCLPRGNFTITSWKNSSLQDPRRNRYLSNQVLAYAHALANYGQDFRWMAFIDVDEFILPMNSDTIEGALASLQEYSNISMPWHMFGRCGHQKRPDGGVLRNFLERASDPMSSDAGVCNFKCIVDPSCVVEVSIHRFKTTSNQETTCNDVGEQFDFKDRNTKRFYSTKHLKLNHYYTKSDDELQSKLNRGSASPVSDKHHVGRVMKTVENIERDTVKDLDMFDFINRHNFTVV